MSIKSYKQVLIYDLERKEKNKKKIYSNIPRFFPLQHARNFFFFLKKFKAAGNQKQKKMYLKKKTKTGALLH